MACKYCGDTGYFRIQQTYNNSPCPCVFCTELAAPKELESIKGSWVACIDRMPDDGVVVLCHEGGDVSALFHRGNGVWDDGDFHSNITGITHWMPLPAAPEGGNG
ncbi:DUF551 domain-containing protein [Serratia sp. CY81489]|uniref:DUF551 domain-containing protein n=1 Tax=unclassified Serratia (in: enterobacteria) TaxID=2647522 RepID=UPI003F9FABB2